MGYTQVLELVGQLPEGDIQKLLRQIQSKFVFTPEERTPMRELILQAPTWTEDEYSNYVEARKHINQSRLK